MRRFAAPAWLPVTFGFFTLLFASGAPTPLYPLYGDAFGLGAGGITVIFAGYVLGVAVTLLLVGHASDEVGRRPLLVAGLSCAFVSGLLFLFAMGPASLFAARFVVGVGNGLFFGAGVAAAVALHPTQSRQFAAVAAQASFSAGATIGPLFGGLLAEWAPFPLRTTWAVYLVLVTVALAGVLRLEDDRRGSYRNVLRPQTIGVPSELRFLFWAVAGGVVALSAVAGLFAALAPTLLDEVLDLRGAAIAGLVMAGQQGVAFVSALSSRNGDPHRTSVLGILSGCAGLGAAAVAAAADVPVLFVLGALLVGVGIGSGYVGLLGAINEQAPPARRAEVVSGYYVATYVGLGAPVVAAGFAADAFGLLPSLAVFSVLMAALGISSAAAILHERSRGVTTAELPPPPVP